MRSLGFTARVCACALTVVSPAAAATIPVPSGGNLHQAILTAQPGDTIVLARGAVYTGNFTLSNKGGASRTITIRTDGDDGLLGAGGRISPANAGQLAVIRSGNTAPAIQTAPGAHHWTLQLLEIQANANGVGDIVTLGDGSTAQTSLGRFRTIS